MPYAKPAPAANPFMCRASVFRLSHRREMLLFSPKMAFIRLTLHAQQRCARKRSAVLPRFFTPKRDSSPASQKANCKCAARKQAEHSSADCIGQAGAFDAINKISHAIGDPRCTKQDDGCHLLLSPFVAYSMWEEIILSFSLTVTPNSAVIFLYFSFHA